MQLLRFHQQPSDFEDHPVDGIEDAIPDVVQLGLFMLPGMPSHPPDGTADLVGYQPCRHCRTPVTNELAQATRQLCLACHNLERNAEMVAEVRRNGQRLNIALGSPAKTAKNRRKAQRRRLNPVHRQKQRRADHASRRALKRLRQLFPDVYATLLAEERARDGLDPYPTETLVNWPTPGSDDFVSVYAQLADEGIEC